MLGYRSYTATSCLTDLLAGFSHSPSPIILPCQKTDQLTPSECAYPDSNPEKSTTLNPPNERDHFQPHQPHQTYPIRPRQQQPVAFSAIEICNGVCATRAAAPTSCWYSSRLTHTTVCKSCSHRQETLRNPRCFIPSIVMYARRFDTLSSECKATILSLPIKSLVIICLP